MSECILIRTPSYIIKMDQQENHYFHSGISREEAEELLKQNGTDGTFLVRGSTTSRGDYVLSLLHDASVIHYQIQRVHQTDAFFSIDEKSTIHGLDKLIDYYRQNQSGLPTALRQIIPSQPPPADDTLNGKTNIVHRAAQHGNLDVLEPCLTDPSRNLEAKNQNGQTAAHIACIYQQEAVLRLLIQKNININCRDKECNTPLHYACARPSINIIRMLIEQEAEVQARNTINGNVPLHEAARLGNLRAVQLLLQAGAAHMPRTNSGEFPIDLALENGHLEVVNYLENYVPSAPETNKEEWFHGTMSREEAVAKLRKEAKRLEVENGIFDSDGVFLVRVTDKIQKTKKHVMSLLVQGEVKNFEIVEGKSKGKRYFYIDEGPFMSTLEHLVEHYQRFKDGLPTALKYPVKPPAVPVPPPVIDFNTIRKSRQHSLPSPSSNPISLTSVAAALPPPALTNKSASSPNAQPEKPQKQQKPSPIKSIITDGFRSFRRNKSVPNTAAEAKMPDLKNEIAFSPLTNLSFKSDFNLDQIYQSPQPIPTTADDYMREDQIINDTNANNRKQYINFNANSISEAELTILNELGQGEFGRVFRGIYKRDNLSIEVAIKKLPEGHSAEDRRLFLQEAEYMMDLNHPCIVRLIGLCMEKQVIMVQELMPLGSLLDYLQKNSDNFTDFELKCLAIEVAKGMEYLVSKQFVHRDLAARNVLLQTRVKAKISDFGLSRACKRDKDYYTANEGGKWPLKWYAPESFTYGKFSHASDVWSFGVLLWELFSRGQVPYGDETSTEVIEKLDRGERLERPEQCPLEIFQIMLSCWDVDPKMRPTFQYLVQFFKLLKREARGIEINFESIYDLTSMGMGNYNNNTAVVTRSVPMSAHELSLPKCILKNSEKNDFVIKPSEIELGREISNGEFGRVLEGIYQPETGGANQMKVAIKTVCTTNKDSHNNFLNEFSLLVKINHINVVKLIGAVVDHPQMIVQEFCPMDSLLNYLRNLRNPVDAKIDIKLWCFQIASGMHYLSTSKNIIHRNLALRNILMQNKCHVKIADFGLAKILNADQDLYVSRSNVKYPLKWCAPESIKDKKFSTKSDVFSYGVVLWEIYSFGEEPWGTEVSGHTASKLFEQGQRLKISRKCPPEVYKQMLLCWSIPPEQRPSFADLMYFYDHQVNSSMDTYDAEYLTASDVRKLSDNNANSNTVANMQPNITSVDKIIDKSDITIKECLGEGEFATVFCAELRNRKDPTAVPQKVAIKRLKPNNAESYRDAFLQEFALMLKLDHFHVVKLLGIVTSPDLMIVQELMKEGPLLSYLKTHKDTISPTIEIRNWAFQVASGMDYLVSKNFVHRDLACRNILLLTKDICKISDFGLSRVFYNEKDYYEAKQAGLWPLKWYAPESFNYGYFSHASDVWSFGVLLYELYSFGEHPYGEKSSSEVIDFIESGGRLDKPNACPPYIYTKMLQCWYVDGKMRPTFSDLMKFFAQEVVYENIPNTIMV